MISRFVFNTEGRGIDNFEREIQLIFIRIMRLFYYIAVYANT